MEKALTTKELYDAVATLVSGYGLPSVALALMQICDDKAHEAAEAWQDIKIAKHWSAAADAAVIFEGIVLKEFGG